MHNLALKLRSLVKLAFANQRPVVLHWTKLTEQVSAGFLIFVLCRKHKGRLRCPPNLTILLVHNRPYKTLVERSLAYLGIEYKLLRVSAETPWRHTAKIIAISKYLENGGDRTDYVMFADADDAMFLEAPQIAIDLLRDSGSEMLASSARQFTRPEHRATDTTARWAKETAEQSGHFGDHAFLNSGVYIARRDFLERFLADCKQYVTDHDLTVAERHEAFRTKAKITEGFPTGCGSDQMIFRHLQPKYFPRLKVDYEQRLALR